MAQSVIMKTFFVLFAVFILIAGVSAALHINIYKAGSSFDKENKMVDSAVIDNVSVGGLTYGDAENKIVSHIEEKLSKKITVKVGDKTFEATYKDLGLDYNIDIALEKAYKFGRSGNVFKDLLAIKGVGLYSVELNEAIYKDTITSYVNFIISKLNSNSKDATIAKGNNGFVITKEQNGLAINKKRSEEILYDAIFYKEKVVDLPVVVEKARITSEELSKIDKRLNTYTTRYNPGKVNRTHNLSRAANSINGTVVMPGDIFSYNRIVGPRNEKLGYKNAIIYENGQQIEGMGGGICQVSSTLFNSVLLSGLEIVQRGNHSLKVAYVPSGRDAMVSYGNQDFKFRNNTKYPIVVFTRVGSGTLTIETWGNSSAYKKCKIDTKVSDSGYNAILTRKVVGSDGKDKIDYTTYSIYMRPKPKEEEKPKVEKTVDDTPKTAGVISEGEKSVKADVVTPPKKTVVKLKTSPVVQSKPKPSYVVKPKKPVLHHPNTKRPDPNVDAGITLDI